MFIIIPLEEEIFKPITYRDIKRGRYEVSNYGRIYDKGKNKFKKTRLDSKGYVWCDFQLMNGKKRTMTVHRIVAWEFVEGYDEEKGKTVVNHKDNNKSNNYYKNLEWVTISENNSHNYWHGNGKVPNIKGEESNLSKYTEEEIRKWCSVLEKGYSPMGVLRLLGYKRRDDNIQLYSLLYSLKNKRAWMHITKEYNF